jgi:hypothetical protein
LDAVSNIPATDVKVKAVAMDFDGTIRFSGVPPAPSLLDQFASLRRSGVKVLIVTGRARIELDRLVDVDLFDAVVLENGAILLVKGEETDLAPPEWTSKREGLNRVFPTIGHERVIISLRRDKEPEIKALLGDSVDLQFNKDNVMILPPGVDKGSGLRAALKVLGVPPQNTMSIGDGENDIPLLLAAGIKVAVNNAVASLKEVADYVTEEDAGMGVSEAISRYSGASG